MPLQSSNHVAAALGEVGAAHVAVHQVSVSDEDLRE